MKQFDVVVVGGGHAGVEAAAAAARLGVKTALITFDINKIGEMSCNPAIGGLGKGHLVREVDALDGLIGRVGDMAAIQYRLLNRRKGPAVRGPRSQIDRDLFRSAMQKEISQIENLEIIQAGIDALLLNSTLLKGVILDDGSEVRSRKVILTTGTFLGGVVHVGDKQTSGGRIGDKSSINLAKQLRAMSLPIGRLKTGTPPRLDGKTINWEIIELQYADDEPELLSFMQPQEIQTQISCGITHTNSRTHDIIRENIYKSAMYSGNIGGKGPRYCPSIEDKVGRFADKDSHQVFLEPETVSGDVIYPNGISTSLPYDIQDAYVRSMKALEDVKILQYGYAIEYDYVDPRALNKDYSLKALDGLYLAGQINGTTGYEEAAAQGIVSGINAALACKDIPPLELSRENSYIGVLIDDLTRTGVSEPYRMFTSRAEYRLSLRADNADQRLTEKGRALGVVHDKRWESYSNKRENIRNLTANIKSEYYSPNELKVLGISVNQDGKRRSIWDLISSSQHTIDDVRHLIPEDANYSEQTYKQVEIEARYSAYIDRQSLDIVAMEKDRKISIPVDFDFNALSGLSNELKSRLSEQRPENLADARDLEGMTPAALSLLAINIRKAYAKVS